MTNKRKLLMRARNNPRGVRFSDMVALVEAFGFEFLRQRGSHHMYAREDVVELVNIQPTKDGKAKDYQVEWLLQLVDRYELTLEETP